MKQDIAGTTMFDGDQAQKGFALNRMCFSFNRPENRAAFLKDEDGYCRKFGLNEQQRAAIKARNVLKLIEAGGNVYYLAKLPAFSVSTFDKLPTFAVGAAKEYRNEDVTQAHRNYHIPISNTAAATIVRSRRAGPPEALSGYHR